MDELSKYLIPVLVSGFVSILLWGLTYIATKPKSRADTRKTDAETSKLYQELAGKQAEDNRNLEKCQDEMERRINDLESSAREKDKRIEELEKLLDAVLKDYEDSEVYINVLVQLMKAANIVVPVKQRRER